MLFASMARISIDGNSGSVDIFQKIYLMVTKGVSYVQNRAINGYYGVLNKPPDNLSLDLQHSHLSCHFSSDWSAFRDTLVLIGQPSGAL